MIVRFREMLNSATAVWPRAHNGLPPAEIGNGKHVGATWFECTGFRQKVRKENRTLTGQSGNFAGKNMERRFSLSLDTWAVTLTLLLALLVGIGVLKHVPW